MSHAVLLVSGGAAVTPFTTPDLAAGSGLAAGNTMTALRSHLLTQGRTVFTSPARIGAGPVHEDTGWQGFAEVPQVLPAELTVNAAGDIDAAGASLARFVAYLVEEHGVDDIDLVVHSMGGLFSRAALRYGIEQGAPLPVQRLITLGTPWSGSLLGDFHAGAVTLADAHDDPATVALFQATDAYAAENSQGAAEEVTRQYLSGPDGWNARQAGVLDTIDVTLIAGTYFHAADEPTTVWPHDGLVQRASALALDLPQQVLAAHRSTEFDDVHSIFIADQFDLPWEKGLTWDPAVFEVVDAALGG
ncbi:MAG: alpha/beta hydrolase [Actinobacteria bacterium]|nr:alpha/beta hydrolase [Actinomycetota bacterium]MCG2802738.1 alpha/beta hydrolase [Cellulomonas sp.]